MIHDTLIILFHVSPRSLQLQRLSLKKKKKHKKIFMTPCYGWDSTTSRLQPLRGGSLLFTIQFPEIPGAYFIDLRRMKG